MLCVKNIKPVHVSSCRLLLKEKILAFTVSPPCLPYFLPLEEQALFTCDKDSCFFVAHQHIPAVCIYWYCQVLGTKWKWPVASATQLLEPRHDLSPYRACTHKSFWCGKIQSKRARYIY